MEEPVRATGEATIDDTKSATTPVEDAAGVLTDGKVAGLWGELYNSHYWYCYQVFHQGEEGGHKPREGEEGGHKPREGEEEDEVSSACFSTTFITHITS